MNKRGMTLIEMIAALAILSIASLTLFGGFSAVLKIMGNSSTMKNNSDMLLSYAEETMNNDCLLYTSMIDFDTMTIPNGLIISLIVPVGIFTVLHPETALMTRAIGFFIVSLPMYLLTLLIPDCFGGGDIKLIAVAGFLLGWKLTLLAFFISVLIGGSYAVYLLLSRKTQKGAHIAFGPYLCAGIMISLLYGETLIQGYLSLFGL